MRAKTIQFLRATFLCLLLFNKQASAQDVYANLTTDSSGDIQSAYRVTDASPTNYAYISNAVALLSTSHIRVRFPVSGQAGDVINISVQGTGQLLGATLLNSITVRLYDSLGNNVENATGSSLLQLALLTNAGNRYAIRMLTNPTQSYKFKEARVEFNNFLTVNLLNEFRVYNVFYQKPCPVKLGTSVFAYGANALLTGYVTNPNNTVDTDPNSYAQLVVPVNILGILPPAYLDLNFNSQGFPGEFVGFTIREASALLSLSLLQNIAITAYDNNGNVIVTQSGFSVANLKLLAGYSDRYMIGVVTPPGNYRIARARITLSGVLNVLKDIDVFNAFHYRITRPNITIVASGSTDVCAGGSITLTAIDSTGGTNFLWSTGATTQTITVNSTGVYSVMVTDTISCSKASLPLQVTVLPPLNTTIVGDTVLCRGNAGVLRANAAFASYKWQNNSTAATLNINATGRYALQVTDIYGCTANDSVDVKYNEPEATPTITNVKCNNSADGAISLNIANGSGNYGYLWSNGSTTTSITNVPPGLYTCILTDNAYNCKHNRAFTIAATNTLSTKATITNTANTDKNDGAIKLDVIGGSGSYTYQWSNGATTTGLNAVGAGIYAVRITDGVSGCTLNDTLTIDDSNSPLNIVPNVTNANGCIAGNGSIGLTVTGGAGNYSYSWSNGATTAAISGLLPGTYYVTVTDNVSSLKKAIGINVGISNRLNVNGTVTGNACNANNGAVSLAVTNGSGNYSYMWNTGATGNAIAALQAGVYIVKVTDGTTGCTDQRIYDIRPGTPAATLTTVLPECNTNANGSINLNTTGTYNYKWSNGATTKDITGLKPGVYAVSINDPANGCTSVYTATLAARPQVQLAFSTKANVACFAPYTGAVVTMASDGLMPYTYSWAAGGNTPDLSNVIGGNYTIMVTDANGCSNTGIAMVATDSTDLVSAVLDSVISVNCIKLNSGRVYIHPERGTGPYSYTWSNGSNTEDLTDVTAGNYALVVTDTKNCRDSLQVKVDNVPALSISKTSSDIKCYGGNDGTISVSVTNGSGNYQYTWSNGSTMAVLTGLPVGTYTVQVKDNKTGCTKDDMTVLAQPAVLELTAQASSESCTGNDGRITLAATGGTQPYTFFRDNVQTGASIVNLLAGNYAFAVTDKNNCKATTIITLVKDCDSSGGGNNGGNGGGNSEDVVIYDVITPNGDGSNDILIITGLGKYPNNELQLFNKWGDVVYTQRGYNNKWSGTDKNGNPLAGGTYYYVLKLNATVPGGKNTFAGYITIQR